MLAGRPVAGERVRRDRRDQSQKQVHGSVQMVPQQTVWLRLVQSAASAHVNPHVQSVNGPGPPQMQP
jgi:hypothetical protein